METYSLKAEQRTIGGKKEIHRLKREGLIPGILYDSKSNIPLSFNEHELDFILNKHGNDVLLTVNVNDTPIQTRVQEVQRDPVTREIQHIDLMPFSQQIRH